MTDESISPPPASATPLAVPQYAAPQYAAPQYATSGNYRATPSVPTNVLAVVSMIASILGIVMMPIVGSIAGVVTGHIAKKQIEKTGEQGSGMAKAGLIVGYVGLGLWVLLVVAYLVFFVVFLAAASYSSTY